jgi:hypothetical protein
LTPKQNNHCSRGRLLRNAFEKNLTKRVVGRMRAVTLESLLEGTAVTLQNGY